MSIFNGIEFKNSFGELPGELYTKQSWSSFEKTQLVAFNESLARELGFDPEIDPHEMIKVFNGEISVLDSEPLAMAYAGHQFGSWVPELGDGRGILFGQIKTASGLRDLHIKGAGKTPYSRFADGRAVLRSTIREYLCGEAMHGLNVPSSRSLIMYGGNEPVFRETTETAAMMVRVARTHIRFGNFEYLKHNGKSQYLEDLLNHVIDEYYSELSDEKDKYAKFFDNTVKATAQLIAHWQAIGFSHGVMNTDNMSILGETFDYGPFGFLENYNPEYICNHSDHEGRYAFNNQPSIGHWNCQALAAALEGLVPEKKLMESLGKYGTYFYDHLADLYRAKLGLKNKDAQDLKLVEGLLNWLKEAGLDYTNFFRNLHQIHEPNQSIFADAEGEEWLDSFMKRFNQEKISTKESRVMMLKNNPKYILRNYLAHEAIKKAEEGDFSEVEKLHKILSEPFDDHPGMESYAIASPDWGKNLEISCSS
ncbi:YdiU family protein [SAR86 cluster bacterium]|nr:YdiU family protein [SAR86 cluster bacterium]